MAGKRRRVSPFALFMLLLMIVMTFSSCAPLQPDFESESQVVPDETPVPVILPPEPESSTVRPSPFEGEGFTYPIATGTICSTLMDTMLEETYRVLDSWDFWTFHVNFQPAPAEVLAIDQDADFAGCFRIYGRDSIMGDDGISETYYPFEEYLLTPCFAENGDVTPDVPRFVTSTGLLTGTAPFSRTLRTVSATSVNFDGSAYVRCEFNLKNLEAQYLAMVSSDPITQDLLPPGYLEDLNAPESFQGVIGRNDNPSGFLDYSYFAMAAAVPNMIVDYAAANNAWATYDTHAGTGFKPPISHPTILMLPQCANQAYDELLETLRMWRDDHSQDDPPLNPYDEWRSILDNTESVEECKGSIQLGATTLPENAVSASNPDSRIAITADLLGQAWLPDFATWAPNGCEKAGVCGFEAPAGGQPTFLWLQYGSLAKVNDTDPCLTPNSTSPLSAVDDAATPPASYLYYLNQKFLVPGTNLWGTWCSPTMTPSVLNHAQSDMTFWLGNTGIYIGYNPITGETFKGAMDEIWIDPDHSIGT